MARCCQRLRRSCLHRVLSNPASTLGGRRHGQQGWTWTSQRCGRYEYQKVLVHMTNPDHLLPRTPSLTGIPPLQVLPGIGGTMGSR
jgi:hypothetical protein